MPARSRRRAGSRVWGPGAAGGLWRRPEGARASARPQEPNPGWPAAVPRRWPGGRGQGLTPLSGARSPPESAGVRSRRGRAWGACARTREQGESPGPPETGPHRPPPRRAYPRPVPTSPAERRASTRAAAAQPQQGETVADRRAQGRAPRKQPEESAHPAHQRTPGSAAQTQPQQGGTVPDRQAEAANPAHRQTAAKAAAGRGRARNPPMAGDQREPVTEGRTQPERVTAGPDRRAPAGVAQELPVEAVDPAGQSTAARRGWGWGWAWSPVTAAHRRAARRQPEAAGTVAERWAAVAAVGWPGTGAAVVVRGWPVGAPRRLRGGWGPRGASGGAGRCARG